MDILKSFSTETPGPLNENLITTSNNTVNLMDTDAVTGIITTDGTGTHTTNINTTAPYITWSNSTIYNWMTIDKAENGFIVKKGYKTYIAKTAKEVLKYLQEDKKGNK